MVCGEFCFRTVCAGAVVCVCGAAGVDVSWDIAVVVCSAVGVLSVAICCEE